MMKVIYLPLVLLQIHLAVGRQMTVLNSCGSTIWPALFTGKGEVAPDHPTGWELPAGSSTTITAPDSWTAGRIWGRTGCVFQDRRFQCLTGGCGQGALGSMECEKDVTNEPPATLAEFTLGDANGVDHYDVSLVDGFNIPMVIHVSMPECKSPSCAVNINPMCPPTLRTSIDQNGKNLGCIAACNAGYGQEQFGNRACCSGAYADSDLCQACGVDFQAMFKENCPTSYAYAFDEKSDTALWTCPAPADGKMADYTIEFCPYGTDYIGSKEPSLKYISATATCSNLATAYTTMFPVQPTPTKIATTGTLSVYATVAPLLDGAAAFQQSNGVKDIPMEQLVTVTGDLAGAATEGVTQAAAAGTTQATQAAAGVDPNIPNDGGVAVAGDTSAIEATQATQAAGGVNPGTQSDGVIVETQMVTATATVQADTAQSPTAALPTTPVESIPPTTAVSVDNAAAAATTPVDTNPTAAVPPNNVPAPDTTFPATPLEDVATTPVTFNDTPTTASAPGTDQGVSPIAGNVKVAVEEQQTPPTPADNSAISPLGADDAVAAVQAPTESPCVGGGQWLKGVNHQHQKQRKRRGRHGSRL